MSKTSQPKIGLVEEELYVTGSHGAQRHTPLGRKVEATQPIGKVEVGYSKRNKVEHQQEQAKQSSNAT